jgi:hypothetical protein
MNTHNNHQEPLNGAENTTHTSQLTLDTLAALLREAGYDAVVNGPDVAVKIDSHMIGLEHLVEHRALSLRTSALFVCQLPEGIMYRITSELTQHAIGVRFYQQWNKSEVLNIAACFEHFYFDESNVNASVLAGLLEHFLAEMQKAFTSTNKMLENLDKVADDLQQLFASRS